MAMVISRGPRLWIPPSGISIATDPVRSRPNWLTAAHEGADNIYTTYDLDPLAPAPSAIKVHFPPRTMSNFKDFHAGTQHVSYINHKHQQVEDDDDGGAAAPAPAPAPASSSIFRVFHSFLRWKIILKEKK